MHSNLREGERGKVMRLLSSLERKDNKFLNSCVCSWSASFYHAFGSVIPWVHSSGVEQWVTFSLCLHSYLRSETNKDSGDVFLSLCGVFFKLSLYWFLCLTFPRRMQAQLEFEWQANSFALGICRASIQGYVVNCVMDIVVSCSFILIIQPPLARCYLYHCAQTKLCGTHSLTANEYVLFSAKKDVCKDLSEMIKFW